MLYESFNLEDGNASSTDAEDWDGVQFLSFEIISFWGQKFQMSLPLKKTFS